MLSSIMKELTQPADQATTRKHKLLNLCVLGFVAILTTATLVTFLAATFSTGNNNAYAIASIYILCMLLAAPTLKVFLDKVTCPRMKRLNIIGIITVFATILTITILVCITLAFPNLI